MLEKQSTRQPHVFILEKKKRIFYSELCVNNKNNMKFAK